MLHVIERWASSDTLLLYEVQQIRVTTCTEDILQVFFTSLKKLNDKGHKMIPCEIVKQ